MPKVKRVPTRLCVGCGQMKPKKELVRVVRTPEGQVDIDPTGKKSGRGVYLCRSVECLEGATKGKKLERALETAIPEDVAARLKQGILVGGMPAGK
ncbi:MAG: RNase P modulator RnpM [Symbiobacteriia bacterium]